MKDFTDFGIQIPAGGAGDLHVSCPNCTPTRRKQNMRDLSVNVEKGVWLCHHCGWTGSLGSGVNVAARPSYKPPRGIQTAPVTNKALTWLESRGITEEVIERNEIGVAKVYVPQLQAEATAISFPYLRGDKHINTKWRAAPKHFFMEPGAERILYKLGDVAATTIICEGELDALSCEVAGLPNAVSVPDGAPSENTTTYHTKFSFLDADAPALEGVKKWILAVDNDGPGRKLEQYLAQRFGPERCYRVAWPEGCKDANDVLVKHGPERLRECVNSATAYPVEGIFDLGDLAEDAATILGEGLQPGVSTGFPSMDPYLTIAPAQLVVVTGIPTSGKSVWLDNVYLNLIRKHQWAGAVFSPENASSGGVSPYADYVVRLAGKWAGKPTQQGYEGALDELGFWNAMSDLGRHLFFIYLNDGISLDGILDRARVLLFRHGIKWLVIDPWNEIEHDRPRDLTETQYVGRCLTKIKRFCRSTGITVFLVAHPAKLQKVGGHYPVPRAYDISDSANWYNKPEVIVSLWRDMNPVEGTDEPDHVVEVHIQKMKFRQFGKPGVARLKWHPGTEVFRDMGITKGVAA